MDELFLAAINKKFWNHVDKTDYCWNWLGRKVHKHLLFGITYKSNERVFSARQISLLLAGRIVLPKKKILPLICNNDLCVNPNHLVAGDKAFFFSKVSKLSEKNGGCWPWIGTLDTRGYGVIQLSEPTRHLEKAHRYSWELHTGRKAPDNLQVCHTCDHPYCVNPNHLFLGTNKDNVDDKTSKGRAAKKLNIIQVKEIKTLLEQDNISGTEISKLYNVSKTTISSIKNGKIWDSVSISPTVE